MDDSAVIRLRSQLPDTEVLTSTRKSHGHGLDLSPGIGAAYIFQLVANTETWVGLSWGSNHTQHVVVAHRFRSAFVHLRY